MWVRLVHRWHMMREDGRPATMCGMSMRGINLENSKLSTLDHKPQDYCCDECIMSIEIEAERKDG